MKGNGHPTNNQNISEYVALLYQKYSHKLYCNAFHYTSNPSIAEDGVQQIFEKILLHPDTALHVPEHEIIYYLFAIQRNPAVIIMRLKYNVHSLIYSKPIFEEKREPENKKIFLFVLFIGNPLSETWFLRVSWLQQFFS